MLDALKRLGGGELQLCEIDDERADHTVRRLATIDPGDTAILLRRGDVLDFLSTTHQRFDLAFVDDNHEKPHVEKELRLLYPLMRPGGIILGHDTFGTCDLQEVFARFGGFSVNLPRLGAAGGLGIIQIAHPESLCHLKQPWKQMV
jgi:predicted O-methyltransferase YrrM